MVMEKTEKTYKSRSKTLGNKRTLTIFFSYFLTATAAHKTFMKFLTFSSVTALAAKSMVFATWARRRHESWKIMCYSMYVCEQCAFLLTIAMSWKGRKRKKILGAHSHTHTHTSSTILYTHTTYMNNAEWYELQRTNIMLKRTSLLVWPLFYKKVFSTTQPRRRGSLRFPVVVCHCCF